MEYDAEIRLLNVAGNQLVRALRFSDWKPVCCQSLDIDPFAGDEFEKALDVSFLGPTHVRQRMIVTSFFIFRIVTAWPIRHRDDKFEFATEERLARNVH